MAKQKRVSPSSVFFDNEEVGSTTKQGANSLVLHNTLHRIYKTLDLTEEALFEDMAKGFMLSIDVAHAFHPNYVDKCDITNRPVLGRGIGSQTGMQSVLCR